MSFEGNGMQNLNTLALVILWSPFLLSIPVNCRPGVFSPFQGCRCPLGSAHCLFTQGPPGFVHRVSIGGSYELFCGCTHFAKDSPLSTWSDILTEFA